MKRITLFLVLLTCILTISFAAEIKTDNLAVKLTVKPELSITFTSNEISDNSAEITGITGKEISLGEASTGTLTSSLFYVTVRTNYPKSALTYNVYGTGLTRYTQVGQDSALSYDGDSDVISLSLKNGDLPPATFTDKVTTANQRGTTSLTLTEPEENKDAMRTYSWPLTAEADVTNKVQGSYIAYLIAEVKAE